MKEYTLKFSGESFRGSEKRVRCIVVAERSQLDAAAARLPAKDDFIVCTPHFFEELRHREDVDVC